MKRALSNTVIEQRVQRLLDQRVEKLQKRVDNAKVQLDDATRNLEQYYQGSSDRTSEEPDA